LGSAVESLHRLHSLFELNLGGRQRIEWIELELGKGPVTGPSGIGLKVELIWSYCNERVSKEMVKPHPADVLLDPERRLKEFQEVVSGWINSDEEMKDSRGRFSAKFGGSYGINRLVGAANMYDILPESQAPRKQEASAEILEAVQKCRSIFKVLPDSFARQAVLGALGRVGNASLRDKILHRVKILQDSAPQSFVDIDLPCIQGVLCRNYYVHGGKRAFDYQEEFNAFAFITETLEFVFAISDLIKLGWDYQDWLSRGSCQSHPFGSYRINFEQNLVNLKKVVENGRKK